VILPSRRRFDTVLRQFKHIYENTDQEYPAVGVLTSANRDLWAKVCMIKATRWNLPVIDQTLGLHPFSFRPA
jgi:hypothetical protein